VTGSELLAWLRSLGCDLQAADGRLKVNAPSGALTQDVRDMILRRKPELLQLLEAEAASRADDRLLPISRDGRLPLSLFQQGLWIAQQLQGRDSPASNLVTLWPMAVQDPDLLRRAIADLIRRHEILRAVIRHEGHSPFVLPLPPENAVIELRDLREFAPDRQAQIVQSEIDQAVTEFFDFAETPPVRWCIYATGHADLSVRVCAHHIAVDEWSFAILRQELDKSLAACAAGEELPAPALQYADYAAWERRQQQSPAIIAELAWWERRLANLPPFCAFPPDRHGPDLANAVHAVAWDRVIADEIRALALQQRVTVYMVLLAALAVVLRAYTGLGDIAIGTSLGARARPELEAMPGPFVNLVTLRLDLQDDPAFATLLARARDAVLDAQTYCHVSLTTLIERLKPARSFEATALFQVALVMHNATDAPPAVIYGGAATQHVTCFARETDTGLALSLQYRSDAYTEATMARVAACLLTVVRQAARDPSSPVGRFALLAEAERARVLHAFNDTEAALDQRPVTRQFESQVTRTPLAPALRFGGRTICYAGLNRRANQIARHLRAQGAGPGVMVGICMERSADLVASLLAVLKAGSAYVPLDPGFPPGRLGFTIAHSGLTHLLTAGGTRPPGDAAVRVIDLDQDAAAIAALDGGDLDTAPDGQDPAYVIYTSGSTGQPNGVVVPHAALANLLGAMLRAPGLASADVLAAVTTISFDIAGLELYLPLLAGARVVLVPRETAADGPALAQLLAEENVTTMQATPATWRLLIEAGWQGGAGFTALCGGEALPPDLAWALLDRTGALWNLYGPTETTIWSTAGRIARRDEPVDIGRPIANTIIRILDEAGQPVPVGVAGEIWIGGAGVALGYHRNPDLTAARFGPDPFGAGAGRLYRTGDLGRWLPDGRIAHMGRLDQQIKLRGFRVEPGEVETVLARHPAVRQAVVLVRGATAATERLVAYVVYRPGQELTASEARALLRLSLPDYMVPAMFVALDAIPTLPNGKTDRRALPDPWQQSAAQSSLFVAPAPGTEQTLAAIWADALQIERVSADANFFDLGGHSLLGLAVIAKIQKQTGRRIQPRTLFNQSLRQIAATLQSPSLDRRAGE
jgi:amino acid adenylation domain-containing protein